MTEDRSEIENVYADWTGLRTLGPIIAAGGMVVVALVVGLVVLWPRFQSEDGAVPDQTEEQQPEVTAPLDPEQAAGLILEEFVGQLEERALAGLGFAFTEGPVANSELAELTSELGEFTLAVSTGPLTIVDSARATAVTQSTWTLEDGTVFSTNGEVDLVLIGTEWLVDWEPAILESTLDPGDVLVRQRVVAPRAPILGRDGVPLVDNRPVVVVGVIPRQAGEIAPLSQTLGALLEIDPGEIQALIAPSPSDSTVRLASIRQDQLSPQLEASLLAVPGVVLEQSTFPLAPDDRFARALLGRSAEVTAEIIDEHPELFVVGDVAGRSGLQRQYNAQLAGVPGFEIRIRRRFPTSPDPGAGPDSDDPGQIVDPDVVYREDPIPGEPLQLTIDPDVQRAAEDALARTELNSALVVVKPSTGEILAVANGPGAALQNLAMNGSYPPGSIFKIVTAYAALEQGFGPDDPIDCPATLEVNGREFRNAEGEVLGTVPLRRAFALSCNTAFIALGSQLAPSDYPDYAARFGLGGSYALGTDSFAGSVPAPDGSVEAAATSFGQARVLVSPLSAAVLAGTAAWGSYQPPSLIVDPEAPAPAGQPLDPAAGDLIQQFMRGVVTGGTGTAVNNVAGGPVSGKTGTAEFGDAVPPQAHAWFVGFQNDLAFAVFVEGGEFGGATAAPIAADFLNRLAGR